MSLRLRHSILLFMMAIIFSFNCSNLSASSIPHGKFYEELFGALDEGMTKCLNCEELAVCVDSCKTARLCNDCLTKYVKSSLDESKLPNCMGPHCSHVLSMKTIKELLENDEKREELIKKYKTLAVSNNPNLRICPIDQTTVVKSSKQQWQKIYCKGCQKTHCFECGDEHENCSCLDIKSENLKNSIEFDKSFGPCIVCTTANTKSPINRSKPDPDGLTPDRTDSAEIDEWDFEPEDWEPEPVPQIQPITQVNQQVAETRIHEGIGLIDKFSATINIVCSPICFGVSIALPAYYFLNIRNIGALSGLYSRISYWGQALVELGLLTSTLSLNVLLLESWHNRGALSADNIEMIKLAIFLSSTEVLMYSFDQLFRPWFCISTVDTRDYYDFKEEQFYPIMYQARVLQATLLTIMLANTCIYRQIRR